MKRNDEPTGRTSPRAARVASAVVALATALACSDGATVIDQRVEPAVADPAAEAPEGGGATTPAGSVYAMTTHAVGPDTTPSYLVALSSLDAGTVMNLDSAIELPDLANVAGIVGEPHVWLGYALSPIIERWGSANTAHARRGARTDERVSGLERTSSSRKESAPNRGSPPPLRLCSTSSAGQRWSSVLI